MRELQLLLASWDWLAQDRRRVWFVGLRTDQLTDAGLDASLVSNLVATLLDGLRFKRKHALSPVASRLLPDWHPRLVSMFDSAETSDTRLDGEASLRRKLRIETQRGCASYGEDDLIERFPGYKFSSGRMRLLLDEKRVAFPEESIRILNLSQLGASDLHGLSPTVTPKGEFWVAHICRPMLGDEGVNLQWIYLTDTQKSKYTPAFLQDLAGNSFCAADCAAAFVVGLVLAAQMFAVRLQVLLRRPAPLPASASARPAAKRRRQKTLSFDSDDSDCSSLDWSWNRCMFMPIQEWQSMLWQL